MNADTLPISIYDVSTPNFLIDLDILNENAKKMLATAKELGVELRPHVKTHKCCEIGTISTGGSKSKISVSTIKEALFFSDGGFTDILYAVPITDHKIKRCQDIIKEVPSLKLMFDSMYGLKCMINNPRNDGQPWAAILDIDCGYGRTGLEWNGEKVLSVAMEANESKNVNFLGLYTHCGNSYDAKNVKEIHKVVDETCDRIVYVAKRLEEHGIKCETVGSGSTPSCNQPTQKMANLTEIHPGGYIFNDYGHTLNGACTIGDIAVKVAARVISHKRSKNHLLIDCGFLALSFNGFEEVGNYGDLCAFQDHPDLRLKGLTQELGKVSVKDGDLDFDKYPIGTMLFIYPFHCCNTGTNFHHYYVHSGDKIVDVWTPVRGW
ncbi:hypothetical protein SNE40_009868 [Patella caerulea]|uniref:D-serine dehydratase n=1 Tax=Patella caerulea TaxID=87958 RepID=A0AAN8JTC8_PATCE